MIHEKCESDLEAYEALYRHKGARIKFYCDRVFYIGIIDELIPQAKQVKLRDTKIADSGAYFANLCFRYSHIKSFTVVESAESVIPKNTYLLNILKQTRIGPDDSVCKVLYGDRLFDESDDEDSKDEEKEEFTLNLPSHLKCRLPNESTVIDEFDAEFRFAVRHLSDQRIIGVSLEGTSLSRFGKLTWVCISTRHCVFLFDLQALKGEAFDRGLCRIFEDKSIKKVFHNCKFASDILSSQYSTQLTNVFDTQVAKLVIDLQRYNGKYEFKNVSSLECCLRNYLSVLPEFLFKQEALESGDKLACHSTRPITNAFRHDLANKVVYLILLYESLAKEVMAPTYKLTGDYLRLLAKASSEEFYSVGGELSPPDSVSPFFIMCSAQVLKFKSPKKSDPVSLTRNFMDLQTGGIIEARKNLGSSSAVSLKVSKKDRKTKHSQASRGANSRNFDSHLKTSKSAAKEDVDCISVRPSYRRMDELYHKLVNKVSANQPEVSVKPFDTYTSTFSVRRSTSHHDSPTDSSAHKDAGLGKRTLPETATLNHTSDSKEDGVPEGIDIWAKIRAESIGFDCPSLQNRKVRFVPA